MAGEIVVEITPPSPQDQAAFSALFTAPAIDFIRRLVLRFDRDVSSLLSARTQRKLTLDATCTLPTFAKSAAREDPSWSIAPLPPRLHNRHIDLGDVSPSDTGRLVACLNAAVSGIQVYFDDGHCPTWHNQLAGWHNIYLAARAKLHGVKPLRSCPVMMLRPRAWNMTEHNVMVGGKQAPGPLVDFGIIMFHNASLLAAAGSGPYFYLSKLEGAEEARLWNEVFVWAQDQLGLPPATVKACVLIENVFASFEMEEILWELRDHSLGLNCGVWDYSASFINKFGGRPDFLLPDRNKYVNMDKPFLANYMNLVVKTCQARGAPATGGMAAVVLPEGSGRQEVIDRVLAAKKLEIEAGVDGFLLYDLGLVAPATRLWDAYKGVIFNVRGSERVRPEDLLNLPKGGVTRPGLRKNVSVGILFISAWMDGKGTFVYQGSVEDSATAEISRSQVWQWIRHGAKLEEDDEVVTVKMVKQFVQEFMAQMPGKHFEEASQLFLEIVTMRDFPEFITTLLSNSHVYRAKHQSRRVADDQIWHNSARRYTDSLMSSN